MMGGCGWALEKGLWGGASECGVWTGGGGRACKPPGGLGVGSAAGARAREPLAQFPGSPALPPRIPALGVSNFRPGRGWRAPGGKSAVPALPAARTSCDLLGRGVLSALRVRGPGERPLPTRRARRPHRGAEPAVEWRGALQLEPFCAQLEVVRCQDPWTLSAPEGRASRAAGCSAPEVSSAPEGVMVRRWARWAPGLSGPTLAGGLWKRLPSGPTPWGRVWPPQSVSSCQGRGE